MACPRARRRARRPAPAGPVRRGWAHSGSVRRVPGSLRAAARFSPQGQFPVRGRRPRPAAFGIARQSEPEIPHCRAAWRRPCRRSGQTAAACQSSPARCCARRGRGQSPASGPNPNGCARCASADRWCWGVQCRCRPHRRRATPLRPFLRPDPAAYCRASRRQCTLHRQFPAGARPGSRHWTPAYSPLTALRGCPRWGTARCAGCPARS